MRIFIPEYIIYFTEFDFSSLNLDSSLLQWVFRAKGKGNAIFIKDVDIQAHYFRVWCRWHSYNFKSHNVPNMLNRRKTFGYNKFWFLFSLKSSIFLTMFTKTCFVLSYNFSSLRIVNSNMAFWGEIVQDTSIAFNYIRHELPMPHVYSFVLSHVWFFNHMFHLNLNIFDTYWKSFTFRTIGYLDMIYMLSIYWLQNVFSMLCSWSYSWLHVDIVTFKLLTLFFVAFSLLSYIISLIFAGRRSNVGTIFADLYFNIDAIMIPFKHHAMNTHDYYKLMENHFKPYFKAGNDYHRRIRKAIQEWDYGVDFDFATERKQWSTFEQSFLSSKKNVAMRFLDDFNLIFGGSSKLWLRLLPILDSFYKNFNSNSFSSEFKRLLWAYYLVALYYLYHAIKNNILRALLNYIRYIKITLGWICGMLAPHTFLVILHSFTNYGPALDKFFDFVDRQYLTEDEFDDEYSNVEQEFALHPLSESELFNLDYVFRIIYSPKRGIWVRKHIVKWFRSVIDEEALFFYNSKYYHDFNTYKQFCLDMIERDPKFFWYEPFVRYLDADYAMHLRSWMCISTIGLNNKGRSARLFDFENFLEPLGGDLFEGFVSLPASSNEKYKFQNIYVAVDSPQFDVDKSGLSYRVKIWLDYFKLLKVSKDYKKHYNMKSAKSKLKSETQPKKPTVRTNEIFFGDEKKYEQTKSRFAQSDPNKTKSFDTNLLRIFLWYKFSNRFRKLVVVIYNANQKWNDVITNVFLYYYYYFYLYMYFFLYLSFTKFVDFLVNKYYKLLKYHCYYYLFSVFEFGLVNLWIYKDVFYSSSGDIPTYKFRGSSEFKSLYINPFWSPIKTRILKFKHNLYYSIDLMLTKAWGVIDYVFNKYFNVYYQWYLKNYSFTVNYYIFLLFYSDIFWRLYCIIVHRFIPSLAFVIIAFNLPYFSLFWEWLFSFEYIYFVNALSSYNWRPFAENPHFFYDFIYWGYGLIKLKILSLHFKNPHLFTIPNYIHHLYTFWLAKHSQIAWFPMDDLSKVADQAETYVRHRRWLAPFPRIFGYGVWAYIRYRAEDWECVYYPYYINKEFGYYVIIWRIRLVYVLWNIYWFNWWFYTMALDRIFFALNNYRLIYIIQIFAYILQIIHWLFYYIMYLLSHNILQPVLNKFLYWWHTSHYVLDILLLILRWKLLVLYVLLDVIEFTRYLFAFASYYFFFTFTKLSYLFYYLFSFGENNFGIINYFISLKYIGAKFLTYFMDLAQDIQLRLKQILSLQFSSIGWGRSWFNGMYPNEDRGTPRHVSSINSFDNVVIESLYTKWSGLRLALTNHATMSKPHHTAVLVCFAFIQYYLSYLIFIVWLSLTSLSVRKLLKEKYLAGTDLYYNWPRFNFDHFGLNDLTNHEYIWLMDTKWSNMFKAFADDIFPGDPYKGYSSSDLGLIFFDMLTIAAGEAAHMNNQYTNTIFDLLDYYGDRLCQYGRAINSLWSDTVMYNLGRFDRMKPFYKMGLPFPSRMFYNGQFTGERDRLYWYVINSYESKDRYLFDMAVPCLYWTRDAMYYRNFAFHLKQEQFQSYLQYFHKMFYFVAVNQKLHFYDLYDYSMLEPSIFNGIGNWGHPEASEKSNILNRLTRTSVLETTFYHPVHLLTRDIILSNVQSQRRSDRLLDYLLKLEDVDKQYFNNLIMFMGHVSMGGGLRLMKTPVPPIRAMADVDLSIVERATHVPLHVTENLEFSVKRVEEVVFDYIKECIVKLDDEPGYKIGWSYEHPTGIYGWGIASFFIPCFAVIYGLFFYEFQNILFSWKFYKSILYHSFLLIKYYLPYEFFDSYLSTTWSYQWILTYRFPNNTKLGIISAMVPHLLYSNQGNHIELNYYRDAFNFLSTGNDFYCLAGFQGFVSLFSKGLLSGLCKLPLLEIAISIVIGKLTYNILMFDVRFNAVSYVLQLISENNFTLHFNKYKAF